VEGREGVDAGSSERAIYRAVRVRLTSEYRANKRLSRTEQSRAPQHRRCHERQRARHEPFEVTWVKMLARIPAHLPYTHFQTHTTARCHSAHLSVSDDIDSVLRGVRVDALTNLKNRKEDERGEEILREKVERSEEKVQMK
jgi:hypothetical protein